MATDAGVIINDHADIYGAVIMAESHCENSFDECRLSAGWPPTLRPNQPTWAASPPIIIGGYHSHPTSPFITITQPEN